MTLNDQISQAIPNPTPTPDNSRFSDYEQNYLRIGDVAPNFQAESTHGTIDFYEYLGNSWGKLLLYVQLLSC